MVMSNPRDQAPEGAKYVSIEDAPEHGYYGYAPGADEDHSVAAVTKDLPGPSGTATVDDTPTSARTAPRSAAKKETDK